MKERGRTTVCNSLLSLHNNLLSHSCLHPFPLTIHPSTCISMHFPMCLWESSSCYCDHSLNLQAILLCFSLSLTSGWRQACPVVFSHTQSILHQSFLFVIPCIPYKATAKSGCLIILRPNFWKTIPQFVMGFNQQAHKLQQLPAITSDI